jgi:hypothetical protein
MIETVATIIAFFGLILVMAWARWRVLRQIEEDDAGWDYFPEHGEDRWISTED